MAKGFEQRLNERRKKGPSPYEKDRGPAAWQETNFPIRRYQGFLTGYKDPSRFSRLRERRYIVD